MGTPGIPYFPLDCQLDEKFQLIEAEFGLKGFAVVVKLLQRIYGINGYYCEWTNDIELLFSMQIGEGRNFVSDIVKRAVERGVFDSEKFEQYHILTSKGIQKRYFEAVSRRKKVELIDDYLIVPATQNSKRVDNFGKNVDISRKKREPVDNFLGDNERIEALRKRLRSVSKEER